LMVYVAVRKEVAAQPPKKDNHAKGSPQAHKNFYIAKGVRYEEVKQLCHT
jgi:hypothetical protein